MRMSPKWAKLTSSKEPIATTTTTTTTTTITTITTPTSTTQHQHHYHYHARPLTFTRYAKFAKKVDVRKLKQSMWSDLASSSTDATTPTPGEKKKGEEGSAAKAGEEEDKDAKKTFQNTMSSL